MSLSNGCPKPWCAFEMPHEHTVGTASAMPDPPPTFAALLNDPAQQLDSEGVVLASVLGEREHDRLRSEGWRACVEHLQREYNCRVVSHPDVVPTVLLDGEALWFLGNVHNPFRPRAVPSTDQREATGPRDHAHKGDQPKESNDAD